MFLTRHPASHDSHPIYTLSTVQPTGRRSSKTATFPSLRHRDRLPSLAPRPTGLHPSAPTLPPIYTALRRDTLVNRVITKHDTANRVSSMRSMPDHSAGGSRASSVSSDGRGGANREPGEKDEFMAHQTRGSRRRKGKVIDEDDAEGDTSIRSDKRRRVTRASNAGGDDHNGSASPEDEPPRGSRRKGAPPALKPIGFAASREARRDSMNSNSEGVSGGGRPIDFDHPIPSPVVMGFDFKAIDNEQLRTVRDTISIKEQQQALIAARRRDVIASNPSTPKELTFKGWVPKDPEKQSGVGRRREKTRDKVEKMTINTGAPEKDSHPGSKSAPLGASLSSQQQADRSFPPSGSQTAVPTNLPPMGYPPNGMDLRTAPMHGRSGREEQELARRGMVAQPHFRRYEPIPQGRGGSYGRAYAVPLVSGVPHGHNGFPPPGVSSESPSPPHPSHVRRESGSHRSHRGSMGEEVIMSFPPPPPAAMTSHGPSAGYPYNAIMENLQQVEALKFTLQDLLHRYEAAYATGASRLADFKAHNTQAGNLLSTLQQSADSLREMVRYEVHKLNAGERKELDELRERMVAIEAKLGVPPPTAGAGSTAEIGEMAVSKGKSDAEGEKKKRSTKAGKAEKNKEKEERAMRVELPEGKDKDKEEEDELDED